MRVRFLFSLAAALGLATGGRSPPPQDNTSVARGPESDGSNEAARARMARRAILLAVGLLERGGRTWKRGRPSLPSPPTALAIGIA
jgi:hypothetical protein